MKFNYWTFKKIFNSEQEDMLKKKKLNKTWTFLGFRNHKRNGEKGEKLNQLTFNI